MIQLKWTGQGRVAEEQAMTNKPGYVMQSDNEKINKNWGMEEMVKIGLDKKTTTMLKIMFK